MTGCVVWITGLPASGKSTLARDTANALRARDAHVVVLDGDAVRAVLVPTLGYDAAARDAFYATLARLAVLIAEQGTIVLVPATAHLRRFRERARALSSRFVEAYVDTPIDECRRRAKALYGGEHAALVPGAGVEYEPPEHADLVVRPGDEDPATALADRVLAGSS